MPPGIYRATHILISGCGDIYRWYYPHCNYSSYSVNIFLLTGDYSIMVVQRQVNFQYRNTETVYMLMFCVGGWGTWTMSSNIVSFCSDTVFYTSIAIIVFLFQFIVQIECDISSHRFRFTSFNDRYIESCNFVPDLSRRWWLYRWFEVIISRVTHDDLGYVVHVYWAFKLYFNHSIYCKTFVTEIRTWSRGYKPKQITHTSF